MDEKKKLALDNMIDNSCIDLQMKVQIEEYFQGKRKKFKLDESVYDSLGEFQKKVLLECSKIPFGKTKTYKDIAAAIGSPKAYRAVGTALGKNPYPIVIPCHRVLGSDGKLHGYAGGLDLKKELLEFEKGE